MMGLWACLSPDNGQLKDVAEFGSRWLEFCMGYISHNYHTTYERIENAHIMRTVMEIGCAIALTLVVMYSFIQQVKRMWKSTKESIEANKYKLVLTLCAFALALTASHRYEGLMTNNLVELAVHILIGIVIGRLVPSPFSGTKNRAENKEISLRLGRIDVASNEDTKYERLIAQQFEIIQKQIERLRKRLDHADIPVFAGFEEAKKSKKRKSSHSHSHSRRHSQQSEVDAEPRQSSVEVQPNQSMVELPVEPKVTPSRCIHCNTTNHPSHRCWVLKKKVKCYNCGGDNHIAVTCQNLPRGGMQFQIQKDTDVTAIEQEINKLRKIRDTLIQKKQRYQGQWPDSNHERQSFLSQSPRLN